MMVERPVAPLAPSQPTASTTGSPVGPGSNPTSAPTPTANPISRWQATHDLACLRAETGRVKVLVDFLARPICAHGGTDPDIVTAYNLAVEAALHGIRRVAQGMAG